MEPTNGYPQKVFHRPVKRWVQTMDLRDNPQLIAEYRRRHSRGEVWPEVLQGIRDCGLLEMEIYILGTRLVMICEAPLDVDWDEAMRRMASGPRQAEWEAFMAVFQQCDPGQTSDEKWQMMERMFYLYE
jgi:L-rhamnose mutarotase